jgi:hypothetical protein
MNNQENQEIVKEMLEKGISEVVIRTGSALELKNPDPIFIKGAIDAPSRFVAKRNHTFEKDKSHALVNRQEKSILLVVNETDVLNRVKISGAIEISRDFEKLGINSGKQYKPQELSKTLKMLKSYFPNIVEYSKVVQALKNLNAKVSKDMQDLNDDRGNTTKSMIQVVESNCPENFTMKLPLFKGNYENVEIEVEILLEVVSSEIYCYLESVNAQMTMDQISTELIDVEIKKIEEFTTIIEI